MRHSTAEICGTCENCRAMDPLPPPDPNETNWIVQVEESLKSKTSDDQRHWNKRSIYRVRACIANLNPKAYQPQVVSFGPYHHGDEHLLPMEEHKRRSLVHFLKRSGKPLKLFLESLRVVAGDLEESYDALDPKWKAGCSEDMAVRFLELMITDGCFMLEILRTAEQKVAAGKAEGDYEDNDPIFGNHGKFHVMAYIRRDMLMLENQLPMLVLDRLVQVESNGTKGIEFINGLILKFYDRPMPTKGFGQCLHVLDVYRKSLLLHEGKPKKDQSRLRENGSTDGEDIIRSATELHERWIRFKKSNTCSLDDISFDRRVLRLPIIVVDDTTESVYLNLIAFEHFHVGAGNEVTSYVFLMDKIINSEQDVQLLQKKGIIQNAIGSDKEVADLFNSLCKDVTLEPNSGLGHVHKEVSRHCKKRWSAYCAILWHDYFKSPWSGLSFFAAIILFGLTTIQTAYTVIYK